MSSQTQNNAGNERMRPRKITILGSTGSIGVSTLDLLAFAAGKGETDFEIEALTANSNVKALAEQARKFKPKFVAIADASKVDELRSALAGTGIEIGGGAAAIIEAAARDAVPPHDVEG